MDAVVTDRAPEPRSVRCPTCSFYTARDDATTDRWRSALSGFDEGIALARETGQTTDLAVPWPGWPGCRRRMGRDDESCLHTSG